VVQILGHDSIAGPQVSFYSPHLKEARLFGTTNLARISRK